MKFMTLLVVLCGVQLALAQHHVPATVKIVSMEHPYATTKFNITLRVQVHQPLTLEKLSATRVPSGWNVQMPACGKGTLTVGDSVDVTMAVSKNSYVPFFPQRLSFEVKALTAQTDTAPVSTYTTIAKANVYFTPYNTIEVWDETDFHNLKRTWLTPAIGTDTTRRNIDKADLPVSAPEPNWGSIGQDDRDIVFVPGLAYAIRQPAVDPVIKMNFHQDTSPEPDGENERNDATALFTRTFTGIIRGRLISTYLNDWGDVVQIPLAGVLVKLKEYDTPFNEEFGEATTDPGGNFFIPYNVSQTAFEGKHVELFLKIKSKNRRYDIEVKESAILGSSHETVIQLGKYGRTVDLYLGSVNLDREHWRLLHWAVRAWDYCSAQGVQLPKDMSILPYRDNRASSFLPDGLLGFALSGTRPTIRVVTGDGDDEGVMRHEFGHFIMWALQGANYVFPLSMSFHHQWENETHPRLAMTEGWADAVEMILDAVYWGEDMEFGRSKSYGYESQNIQDSIKNGVFSEYYFACALYDLWDGPGKQIPERLGVEYIGFRDVEESGVASSGWSRPDEVEYSFAELLRPFVRRSGGSGKMHHVGEYFEEFIKIAEGDCGKGRQIVEVFSNNRVVWDIPSFLRGFANGLSADGWHGSVQRWYRDFWGLYYSETFHINSVESTTVELIPASLRTTQIEEDLTLRLRTVAVMKGLSSESKTVFQTCGDVTIRVDSATLEIGGPDTPTDLIIASGGALIITHGAVLRLNGDARLHIACGGRLRVDPGARIESDGTQAVIISEGIVIDEGAVVSVPMQTFEHQINLPEIIPASGAEISVIGPQALAYEYITAPGWLVNGAVDNGFGIIVNDNKAFIKPPTGVNCDKLHTVRVRPFGCGGGWPFKTFKVRNVGMLEGTYFNYYENLYTKLVYPLRDRNPIKTGGSIVEIRMNAGTNLTVKKLSNTLPYVDAGGDSKSGSIALYGMTAGQYVKLELTTSGTCENATRIVEFYVGDGRYSISPNPASTWVTLQQRNGDPDLTAATPFTATLHNSKRQMLYNTSSAGGPIRWDVSAQPEGYYIVNIHDEDGLTQTTVYVKR